MDAYLALKEFSTNIGVPEILSHDGAEEFCGHQSDFVMFWKNNHCKQHVNETEKQKFNQAEGVIRVLKTRWKSMIIHKNVLLRLWDFIM